MAARTLRAVLALLGVGVIGFGLYGLLHDPYIRDPSDVLVWGVGGLVLHDGIWLPLVLLAGTGLARRPLLRGGLIVATALSAVALPAVLRAGTDRGNPTVLPLPYLHNWLLLLALVAAAVTLLAVVRGAAGLLRSARRSARRRPPRHVLRE